MSSEGAPIKSYRDLKAWREAMLLAQHVYALTAKLPPDERFGLVQQLRRSAISVPSNIAEGHARGATRDFARFIAISRGSLAEIETQIELCLSLGMLNEGEAASVLDCCDEVGRILRGLRKSLDNKLAKI
ncbi:MAG TPA: four helix bundle protein [Rhodanobacteraceae bacterium]|nr:four helix bundle protein [Rhodanobacteraceae bacterium]